MKTALLAVLAIVFSASAAIATIIEHVPIGGGGRFPAVTVVAGQDARVVVSNLLVPPTGNSPAACPVRVRFFAADGTLIGNEQNFSLKPEAAISVPAGSAPGIVRAIVSIPAESSNPNRIAALEASCLIVATEELVDMSTGRTVLVVTDSLDCSSTGKCGAGGQHDN